MTGGQVVSLFVPDGCGGWLRRLIQNAHWQEEAGGLSGDGTLRAGKVFVYAPVEAAPVDLQPLCGVALAALGEQDGPHSCDSRLLVGAVKHEVGSPALHHWELVLA